MFSGHGSFGAGPGVCENFGGRGASAGCVRGFDGFLGNLNGTFMMMLVCFWMS
jgi:hypothetical protein